jgi:hypothetical protein
MPFKTNPKTAVENTAKRLFKASGKKIIVAGARAPVTSTGRKGQYHVICSLIKVGEEPDTIAVAEDRNWRLAYKKLNREVEIAFERGLGGTV